MSTTGTAEPDTTTTTDFSLMMLEDFEFEVPCDSIYCRNAWKKDSHAADWIVAFDCGCMSDWCDERLSDARDWLASGRCIKCMEHGPMRLVRITAIAPIHVR